MRLKLWHVVLLAVAAVVAAWAIWRRRGLDVNATVTIPEDEIRTTSSKSLFSIGVGDSSWQGDVLFHDEEPESVQEKAARLLAEDDG